MKEKIIKSINILWIYLKYQIVTKGIVTLFILPLSSIIIDLLLKSSGRSSVSSSNFIRFLFSIQGIFFLFIVILLFIILIGVDINAFIYIGSLICEGKTNFSIRSILILVQKSLKSFLKPSGLFVLLYVALIVPLTGIGFTINLLKQFEIPNFITDVIFNNTFYTSIYIGLLIILFVVSIIHCFIFHYILILKNDIVQSLKKSRILFLKYYKSLIFEIIKSIFVNVGLFILIGSFILVLTCIICRAFNILTLTKEYLILITMFLSEYLFLIAFMSMPIFSYILTNVFYRYNKNEGNIFENEIVIKDKDTKVFLKLLFFSIIVFLIISFNIIFSKVAATYFDEIFKFNHKIEIVAHRGGGDLAAENTVESLKKAIEEKISWSEIDVQRTKDGYYIINHDSDFLRVANDKRKAQEMSLFEIKQLSVKDLFDTSRPSYKVATLEEFLDAAKGKIGLYIELKGVSADFKMVDDVVEIVKSKNMIQEVALISLDYSLIEYIEEKYPEVTSGFLYFFAFGKVDELKGDILIMEEREATIEKIDSIKSKGKKVVVWTVNSEESIAKFVNMEIDGIITDCVKCVKLGIEKREKRSDIEIVIDNLLN